MENNKVSVADVTFLSLAFGDFSAAAAALVAHDYFVYGGLLVLGVILVYLYHRLGSPTVPPQS